MMATSFIVLMCGTWVPDMRRMSVMPSGEVGRAIDTGGDVYLMR